MREILRGLSVVFSAGAAGGAANSVAVWAFGKLGVTGALGVKIAPALKLSWLYPRVVWGGIWGLLFLLPFLGKKPVARGVLMSLGPTLVQLLYIFPAKADKGMFGLELGALTPLFVIIFNAIWGIVAAYWVRACGKVWS